MVKKTPKAANKKSASPKKSAPAKKRSASPAKSVKKAAPSKNGQKPVKIRLDMLFSDPLKQAAKASARRKMQ
jgi:hypothetical protein